MTDSTLSAFREDYRNCRFTTAGHKNRSPRQTLQALAESLNESEQADIYGSGALIRDFERQVADLLGKPAALFLPSGTLAQPVALRIHADRARSPYVALPPTSHLVLHEQNSYQLLYGLKGVMLGQRHQVPQLADLQAAAQDPLAAILLELPMREIGGQLPPWEELVAQSRWAHQQGIKLHMDGARLWQCPAHYGRSLAEICALFDSVYVSFYKDLGGIAGAVLAGERELISAARVWQRRAGGNLYALYPYVVAAREGLKQHLPQMTQRVDDARWLASELNKLDQLETWPLIPHTSMFRLRIQCQPDEFLTRAANWMAEHGVGVITPPYQIDESSLMCELSLGDAFAELSREQWQQWLTCFAQQVLQSA